MNRYYTVAVTCMSVYTVKIDIIVILYLQIPVAPSLLELWLPLRRKLRGREQSCWLPRTWQKEIVIKFRKILNTKRMSLNMLRINKHGWRKSYKIYSPRYQISAVLHSEFVVFVHNTYMCILCSEYGDC